jgi:catechol 2,3-dioxygenase-like lactoylglutathione lyase family enzyme
MPAKKARAIGFNHVALEVGDIEEALAFYGRLFDFKLRGKSGTSAFIDLGDQFLALAATSSGRRFLFMLQSPSTSAPTIRAVPAKTAKRAPHGNRCGSPAL